MQEVVAQDVFAKSGRGLWYLSLFLVIFVLGSSGVCFTATYLTNKTLIASHSKTTEFDDEIARNSTDRTVLIADILSSNTIRPSIDVRKLVLDFRKAASMANVRLQGFSVKDDTISTTLIATE
jgi:hypothetical protein